MAEAESGRLVLGTAQLGMNYGVANVSGHPDRAAARAIVEAAWEMGVRCLDTAQAYGESEAVLGDVLGVSGLAGQVRVITKTHPAADFSSADAVRACVRGSLERLGVPRVHGVLLHREECLADWDSIGAWLRRETEAGTVERVGVSVYSAEGALRALSLPGLGLVQLPTNALDRRFEQAGVFELAAERGVEIHIRSIFLQGLLLMPVERVPAGLAGAVPFLRRLDGLCAETGLSRAALALAYVRESFPHAAVLFGAETEAQVRENGKLWSAAAPAGLVDIVRAAFQDVPTTLLNPSLWKL